MSNVWKEIKSGNVTGVDFIGKKITTKTGSYSLSSAQMDKAVELLKNYMPSSDAEKEKAKFKKQLCEKYGVKEYMADLYINELKLADADTPARVDAKMLRLI